MNEHFIVNHDFEWMPADLDFVRDDGVFRNFSLSRRNRIQTFSLPSHEAALTEIDAILAALE